MNDVIVNLDAFIDKFLKNDSFHEYRLDEMLSMIFGLPKSVYTRAVYDRMALIKSYKAQLKKLLALPVIEQRTPEWYEARQTLITASDFAQALGEGKFGTQKQLIQKKCGFEEDKFDNSAAALRWGTMFEDVACGIYAQRNNCKIYNFGLLRHPDINYFGASPDGITEDGIMVEIKCPWKRKIDGTVPMQYFYQIQGQLDVCGLSECDYWECEFIDSVDAADTQGPGKYEKGVILEKANNQYIYSHSCIDFTADGLEKWYQENTNDDVIKVHYYALTKTSCVRVYKDKEFLNDKLEKLGEVWNRIKEYRADEDLYNKEIKALTSKPSPYKLTGFAFMNI